MTTVSNPYDNLYNNLRSSFSYLENGHEYTLGESMLMRAECAEESMSMLPVSGTIVNDNSFGALVSYVNNKLTISCAPEKKTTMRRFPLRSSFSAIFSAVAACALVFSFGIFALTGNNTSPLFTEAPISEVYEAESEDIPGEEIFDTIK